MRGAAVRTTNSVVFVVGALLLMGCSGPEPDEEPVDQAPAAIGDEVIKVIGSWSDCSGGLHLYRSGRQIQSQCFGPGEVFRYENRGTLTEAASAALDDLIVQADVRDTTPVNHKGLCGAADAVGTVTLWVGPEQISFDQSCPIEGVVPLYEHVTALRRELSNCGDEAPEHLESFEPGCRAY